MTQCCWNRTDQLRIENCGVYYQQHRPDRSCDRRRVDRPLCRFPYPPARRNTFRCYAGAVLVSGHPGWSFDPSAGRREPVDGHIGQRFIIWIGFVLPALSIALTLRGHPWSISLADATWWLAIMLTQSAVLHSVGLAKPPLPSAAIGSPRP